MPDDRHVVLVGPMGSGKTTIGVPLAVALSRPFIDNDAQVLDATGLTAAQLAARAGADALHDAESAALLDALGAPVPSVIAAAASTVADPAVRRALDERVFVVWLRAAPEVLAARLPESPTRPFAAVDPAQLVARLARERDPLYAQIADLTVAADVETPGAVVARILEHLANAARGSVAPIVTARLCLVVLDASLLAAMQSGNRGSPAFTWPDWWPDETDRHHLARWREQAASFDGHDGWRPRAIVVASTREMVGHAGFHLPPRSIEVALADPSFSGVVEPAASGAVEIGYTIFPAARHRGYATESVSALVEWAFSGDAASAVVATVALDNAASRAVLERAGGFRAIGTCAGDAAVVETVFRRDRGRPGPEELSVSR